MPAVIHSDRLGRIRLPATSPVPAQWLTPGTYRLQSVLYDGRRGRHVVASSVAAVIASVPGLAAR